MKNLLPLLLLSAAAILVGCGGSPAASNQGGTSPVVADSAYTGQYTVQGQGTFSVIGAIGSGVGYFADGNGAVYFMPSISTSGTISGTLEGYAPPGFVFPSQSSTQAFTVTGTATGAMASSISGSFSGGGESGTFSLTAQPTTTPTLSGLAGSYSGFYLGPTAAQISLTIDGSGHVTGSDAYSCSITGTVTAPNGPILPLSVVSSCSGTLTGLGFQSASDLAGAFGGAAGTYIYFGGSNTTAAFAAELEKN